MQCEGEAARWQPGGALSKRVSMWRQPQKRGACAACRIPRRHVKVDGAHAPWLQLAVRPEQHSRPREEAVAQHLEDLYIATHGRASKGKLRCIERNLHLRLVFGEQVAGDGGGGASTKRKKQPASMTGGRFVGSQPVERDAE
eukprot:CAMPEP_0185531406 /NCGR_PEP_ID=MMETSP1366-20130426/106572_1 /TAXON_ID=38817 /ORGANISM="Gephyrocapsa oceanica, Strain RCC1303" /LENGTH=141 /DNA_ID=CAMNT_0028143119 /DNA_START=427 /DNA_END=853 /DNA_ORIENTATION=+